MHTTDIQRFDVIEYNEAVEMMAKLQMQRIKEEIPDTLLILEHPEIVTVGPRARNDGIHPPPDYATQAVDRGGGLTWHGPGQLVVYPILHWNKEDEKSVAAIIHKLETWVIESLSTLGIEGYRDERMQGVWVAERKICSIGLSFLRWVSRHGLTINYQTPLGRVENLAGCGLSESTTTSLHRLNHSVSRQDLEQALLSTYHSCLNR